MALEKKVTYDYEIRGEFKTIQKRTKILNFRRQRRANRFNTNKFRGPAAADRFSNSITCVLNCQPTRRRRPLIVLAIVLLAYTIRTTCNNYTIF